VSEKSGSAQNGRAYFDGKPLQGVPHTYLTKKRGNPPHSESSENKKAQGGKPPLVRESHISQNKRGLKTLPQKGAPLSALGLPPKGAPNFWGLKRGPTMERD